MKASGLPLSTLHGGAFRDLSMGGGGYERCRPGHARVPLYTNLHIVYTRRIQECIRYVSLYIERSCPSGHIYHMTLTSTWRVIIAALSLEEAINLVNIAPPEMIYSCMAFVVCEGVNPLWKDEDNKKGGSFSFKLDSDKIYNLWKDMVYTLTLTGEYTFDCAIQNPKLINTLLNLDMNGVLFKNRTP